MQRSLGSSTGVAPPPGQLPPGLTPSAGSMAPQTQVPPLTQAGVQQIIAHLQNPSHLLTQQLHQAVPSFAQLSTEVQVRHFHMLQVSNSSTSISTTPCFSSLPSPSIDSNMIPVSSLVSVLASLVCRD